MDVCYAGLEGFGSTFLGSLLDRAYCFVVLCVLAGLLLQFSDVVQVLVGEFGVTGSGVVLLGGVPALDGHHALSLVDQLAVLWLVDALLGHLLIVGIVGQVLLGMIQRVRAPTAAAVAFLCSRERLCLGARFGVALLGVAPRDGLLRAESFGQLLVVDLVFENIAGIDDPLRFLARLGFGLLLLAHVVGRRSIVLVGWPAHASS